MQNTSHAVMSQRVEALDSPDDFPTPPWATRGLLEFIIGDKDRLSTSTCLEPACGVGHMAKVLKEYFGEVVCASYLVPTDGVERFAEQVRTVADRHPELWLSCTGPWPPYSFVELQVAA